MNSEAPRATNGRAPDVFTPGGWTPMREYAESDAVDFLVIGAGAGGATLGCRLAERGFSVVILEAGPFWRPLDDFASDELAQQIFSGPMTVSSAATTRLPSAETIPGAGSAVRPFTTA